MSRCPVILLADCSVPKIANIASQLKDGLGDTVEFLEEAANKKPHMAIAIGGDGTLIKHGRTLAQKGIPLVGVNSGKLGFLAKFDVTSLITQRDSVFVDVAPMVQTKLLQIDIDNHETCIAMNEAMIAAGFPFRLIELGLSINGVPAPSLRGDGIILSSPIGSTAHNASVGGPIVDPSAKVMVLTPLAAHSLAVRPIIMNATADVILEILQVNEGTALIVDGEVKCKLENGMKVRIRQSKHSLSIVLNPTSTYWNTLVDKLHWAAPPG